MSWPVRLIYSATLAAGLGVLLAAGIAAGDATPTTANGSTATTAQTVTSPTVTTTTAPRTTATAPTHTTPPPHEKRRESQVAAATTPKPACAPQPPPPPRPATTPTTPTSTTPPPPPCPRPPQQSTQPQPKPSSTALPPATTGLAGFPIFATPPISPVPGVSIAELKIPPFLIPIYQAAAAQYGVPWQLLAAINWVETDFGRDLSTSSAGAVGWMQFLPSTWRTYGVDATGSGYRDPYNPVDAIFAAARYLAAAGAPTNLTGAIYAYNPAGWYVQDVMARMKAIQQIPDQLTTAVGGLADGNFPVAAAATYAGKADGGAATKAGRTTSNGLISITAPSGAPVVAVGDGHITATGTNGRLGHYVVLADAYANSYTYGHLGSVVQNYDAPRPGASAMQPVKLPPRPSARPSKPASAGIPMALARTGKAPKITGTVVLPLLQKSPPKSTSAAGVPTMTVRLDVQPLSANSPALPPAPPPRADPSVPAGRVLKLASGQTVAQALRPGASVAAGTILGRVGSSGITFSVQPGGAQKPLKDPAPVLNSWRLLGAASPYRPTIAAISRAARARPAGASGGALLMTRAQLEGAVLGDSRVQIYGCGRGDIQAGRIDRRVLATLEFLADSGLKPTVSSLECGHSLLTASGNVSEHATGDAVDIAAINGVSIVGHQGPGSITEATVRKLLTLQGAMKPHQIISLESVTGADNVLPLASHYNHIHVGFRPAPGDAGGSSVGVGSPAVGPIPWDILGQRLRSLRNPTVGSGRSAAAITDD